MLSFQLNLIHSEISNLAGFDVEGVINPTNADIDLKDDLGEAPESHCKGLKMNKTKQKILEN